ncbi:HAD family phosphatase [Streptomyces sp. NBC_01476]|uniref:HAD family hydrolase n=1 Tax=Streptomyces sp. NBC_01476 TaxID=2903881 RepID=UPI002E309C37|nr:HAD family phosphatase [Streptomyces sp. NBC_01476]
MTPSPRAKIHEVQSSSADEAAPSRVRELFEAATCVILDFDGPICQVFAGRPAAGVAERMLDWLVDREMQFYSNDRPDDPMQILLDAGKKLPVADVEDLEQWLAHEEMLAVDTAQATPGAEAVIRALEAEGRRLAIASNNAHEAITRYNRRAALSTYFGGNVHGRAANPALMKPNPDCVRRALESTGAKAAESLLIGDSPSDYVAAHDLGVAFLGFGGSGPLRAEAGIEDVVNSWEAIFPA